MSKLTLEDQFDKYRIEQESILQEKIFTYDEQIKDLQR